MFYERLKELCKTQGKTLTNVISELGMSGGNLSKWKNGTIPKSDTIHALSEYFNVSSDYLLGIDDLKQQSLDIVDNQTITLTAKEVEIILKYRNLDAEGKTMVESVVIQETRRMVAKAEGTNEE